MVDYNSSESMVWTYFLLALSDQISRVYQERSNSVSANPHSSSRNSLWETSGEQPEGSVAARGRGGRHWTFWLLSRCLSEGVTRAWIMDLLLVYTCISIPEWYLESYPEIVIHSYAVSRYCNPFMSYPEMNREICSVIHKQSNSVSANPLSSSRNHRVPQRVYLDTSWYSVHLPPSTPSHRKRERAG
jgi:hypothetical protein